MHIIYKFTSRYSRSYNRDLNPGLPLYETEVLSVFEVLTAVLLNIQVFCDVTLCE